MINFPNSPAVGDSYTFGGRSWVWNGRAWQSAVTGVQTRIEALESNKLDAAIEQLAEVTTSATTDYFYLRRGNQPYKYSVQSLQNWIFGNRWGWLKSQVFTEGVSVGASTVSVDPDPAVYGPGIHIQTSTKLGGAFDAHSGGFLRAVMPGGWGSAQLHVNLSTGFGSFETANPAMLLAQSGLTLAGAVSPKGGAYIGELSPLFKIKQITGNTGAAGTTTNIAHGIGAGAKILAVLPAVQTPSNNWVANAWQLPSALTSLYNVYWNDTNVIIDVATGATQVARRPFKALIVYTP